MTKEQFEKGAELLDEISRIENIISDLDEATGFQLISIDTPLQILDPHQWGHSHAVTKSAGTAFVGPNTETQDSTSQHAKNLRRIIKKALDDLRQEFKMELQATKAKFENL